MYNFDIRVEMWFCILHTCTFIIIREDLPVQLWKQAEYHGEVKPITYSFPPISESKIFACHYDVVQEQLKSLAGLEKLLAGDNNYFIINCTTVIMSNQNY